jgi:hypothetical protein
VLGGELLFELVDGDLEVHGLRIKGAGSVRRGPFRITTFRTLSWSCKMLM